MITADTNTADTPTLSPVYKAAVVGLFLFLLGIITGLAYLGTSDAELAADDNPMRMPIIFATAPVCLFILTRLYTNRRRILGASHTIASFVPIMLFCVVSAAWSAGPESTVRRAIILAIYTLIGFVLGVDFEIGELMRLLAAACLIHVALCAIFFVVAPSNLYSSSDVHSFKGLTIHKNVFGFEQGLALLVFLFVPFRRFPKLRFPLCAVSCVLLILSHSAGSLAATVCALALLPLLFFIVHIRGTDKIPIILLSLVAISGACIALFMNASVIPALFSKSADLTGRTELWSLLLVAIGHHPLLGYGYDSFWQGLQGDSLAIIRSVRWFVPHAHNGYLDLLLGTGFVGAALFLPPLFQAIYRALRYLSIEHTAGRFFPITFIFFWLVYNLNESYLLTRNGIHFILFVSISTSLAVRIAQHEAECRVIPDYSSGLDVYSPPADFVRSNYSA
jgi:O-antigen ligase